MPKPLQLFKNKHVVDSQRTDSMAIFIAKGKIYVVPVAAC